MPQVLAFLYRYLESDPEVISQMQILCNFSLASMLRRGSAACLVMCISVPVDARASTNMRWGLSVAGLSQVQASASLGPWQKGEPGQTFLSGVADRMNQLLMDPRQQAVSCMLEYVEL